MRPQYHVGLMSGTSLDGVDAVLADFSAAQPLLAAHHLPFTPDLKTALWALLRPGYDEIARAAALSNDLARHYAQAVATVLLKGNLDRSSVAAIGCHGQTVRHQPRLGYSVQLGNGALLAELTGIKVVCDFRSRDIAAAGQGAPLVPAYHSARFRDAQLERVIVNLGGIANLTHLPPAGSVRGFDCGPANALLDEWILRRRQLAFDTQGAWAAEGNCLPELLDALLAHPFFGEPPPKSTGRDTFNLAWASAYLREWYRDQDVQATFAELTARCVADAIARWCGHADEVFLCGGGAHNVDLAQRIQRLLHNSRVATTAALGVAPDWVEALAFAWLARETVDGHAGNIPAVTGASGARCLGCIYPA